ncbi:vascular endothelial growth factor receptor 3-like isoform X2 [Ptychodera flava]
MGVTETEVNLPDVPNITMIKNLPQRVLVSWESDAMTLPTNASNQLPFPVYYVIQAYKKPVDADSGMWIVFNQTNLTSFVMENLDICASYQLQVAAVNPFGTRGFSQLTNVTAISQPGAVEGCQVNRVYYVNGDINADLSCDPPSDLTGPISGYQVHVLNKKCINKISTDAASSIHVGHGQLVETIKLAKSKVGCHVALQVEAYSGCVYGQKTAVELDLTDCSRIENYNCEPTVPRSLPPVKDVFISEPWITYNDSISVSVSWTPVDTSERFHGYIVKWGHPLRAPIYPQINPETAKEKYVPKEQNSTILQNLDPDTTYVVKVGVQGSPTPKISFQMLRSYSFDTKNLFEDSTIAQNLASMDNSTLNLESLRASLSEVSSSTTVDQTGLKISMTKVGELDDSQDDREGKLNAVMLALYIALPLLCVVVVIILIYVYFRYQRLYSTKSNITEDKEEGIPNIYISPKLYRRPHPDPHDRWEVSHSRITFGEVLGQGAFGQVMKGKIEGRVLTHQNSQSSLVKESVKCQDVEVAVKMLHEHAESSQKQEFLREIDLMKDIGHHSNVVSIIACCTIQEPLCLIVEHCQQGDLLNYLRKRRSEIESYDLTATDSNDNLMPSDLLSFARQIAIGMEFLSQKGFVHRDLAARNVLVADHKTVKIGDFGLTRYIYDDKIYHNKKGGKLPIKWMSVEAIFDQLFTTQSDVWSFGVVLFELVTLGGCPYPGISNHCVVQLLKRGYRMEKPDNCSDNLYDIMLQCWREKPRERPSFTELRQFLESLLEQNTPYLDFNLDENKDYYKFSSDTSWETSQEISETDSRKGDSVTLNPNAWRFTISSSISDSSGSLHHSKSEGQNDDAAQDNGATALYSNRGPRESDPLMTKQPEQNREEETEDIDKGQHEHIFVEDGNQMKLKEFYIRKDFHRLIETNV